VDCYYVSRRWLSSSGGKWKQQETQLSLTNRATRLEILTFEKYRDLQTGVRVTEAHWECHHSIQRMRLPILMFNSNYSSI